MNILGGISVYATICKHEGLPFHYPGNQVTWEHFGDASDAELIAEQEIWASIEPSGQNQALNIANGDVFRFKQMWYVLAKKFGLEVPPYRGQPFSLETMMADKGPIWDAIVKEHDLLPAKLEEVGCWWFVDLTLNAPRLMLASMNKSKDFGFHDSEKSAHYWVDEMKKKKIIP